MKLTLTTFVVVVFSYISGPVFGQNGSKELTTMKTENAEKAVFKYTYQVDSAKLATKKVSDQTYNNSKDINYYNNFISALEYKRAHVMNDPQEKALAEESGWFEQIDAELKKAKAEREELQKK